MPYIGKSPQHGNYSKIDDISSGFDGSDATHAIASNSIAITPVRPEALIISINGVIQEPVTDYTVSGTNITFTTAPASTDSFFGVVMGEQLAIGTPSDATVTSAKLSGNLVTPGTLDVNGQELILDADADTSITADTDDQIDIRVSGSDQIKIAAGEVAFNDASADIDFRVESNGNANMLFVDGGNDRVGIGTNSPDSGMLLHTSSSTDGIANLFESTGGESLLKVKGTKTSNGAAGTYQVLNSGNTIFQIITERYAVDNSSLVKIYTADAGTQRETLRLCGREDHYATQLFHERSSGVYGLNIFYANSAPDGSTNFFLRCADSSAVRLTVASDGDVLNHDGTHGTISDERIKQDIRDANSQWDDLKAVRIRNFKKKDDVRQYGDNAPEQIGLVAQELEAVSPKLVKELDPEVGDILSDSSFGTLYEDGDDIPDDKKVGDVKEIKDKVKMVKNSILFMKAVKALQEAMARIETLESEVTALKGG